MKQLILVKHSLPEIVEDVPAREWELSEKGRALAERLADRLRQYQPEVVISSTEPKAKQTAEIVSASLDITPRVVDGLHEHDRSHSPIYSQEKFQTLVRELFDKPDVLVFGDETANQALTRFRDSINAILNSHVNKNLVVVAHGTVISLFVSWLTGLDGYLLWKELGLPSFVVLDIQSKVLLKTENIS
jgi:broad specificity phosphatase PhoE